MWISWMVTLSSYAHWSPGLLSLCWGSVVLQFVQVVLSIRVYGIQGIHNFQRLFSLFPKAIPWSPVKAFKLQYLLFLAKWIYVSLVVGSQSYFASIIFLYFSIRKVIFVRLQSIWGVRLQRQHSEIRNKRWTWSEKNRKMLSRLRNL